MNESETNWAGNYRYRAGRLVVPENVAELQSAVRAGSRLKAVGSRHCFNDIADSAETQVSLARFDSVEIGESGAKVGAGLAYGRFCGQLARRGFALHNLASLPHISVAGACMTATHGSGSRNGNLASAVSRIEFVDGRGEAVALSRGDSDFGGAVVSLGALGIATRLTLDVVPNFEVRQNCFVDLPLAAASEGFDEIMSAAYSVSMFTDWRAPRINQIWVKSRVDAPAPDFGGAFREARPAASDLHPIDGVSPENCTPQMGVPGVWYERLPHFRMGFTPSVGAELQSEYFVGTKDAVAALAAIASMCEEIAPLLLVSEIRAVASDEMWLSMNYQRDSVAFHFTWKQDERAVMNLLPKLESKLERFDARPHWGKLFTITGARLRELYPRFGDFGGLTEKYDPEGKFRNGYLERLLG